MNTSYKVALIAAVVLCICVVAYSLIPNDPPPPPEVQSHTPRQAQSSPPREAMPTQALALSESASPAVNSRQVNAPLGNAPVRPSAIENPKTATSGPQELPRPDPLEPDIIVNSSRTRPLAALPAAASPRAATPSTAGRVADGKRAGILTRGKKAPESTKSLPASVSSANMKLTDARKSSLADTQRGKKPAITIATSKNAPVGKLPPASAKTKPKRKKDRPYTIKAGDTFASIAAAAFGSERFAGMISQANPGADPRKLRPGHVILLPAGKAPVTVTPKPVKLATGWTYHVIRAADSLSRIADKYYKKPSLWPVIYRANRELIGVDPNKIQPGVRLVIPPLPTED